MADSDSSGEPQKPISPTTAPASRQAPAMLGTLGTLVTILVAAWGAYEKGKYDESSQAIEDRRTKVEESRERVERYRFVLSTLTGLEGKNTADRSASITMARLALTDSEAGDLFRGLAASSDSSSKQLGNEGAAQQRALKHSNAVAADSLERQGYRLLIEGRIADAAASFEGAEAAYPTYHQAYELGRFLRRSSKLPPDTIRAKVLKDYSLFANATERRQLGER